MSKSLDILVDQMFPNHDGEDYDRTSGKFYMYGALLDQIRKGSLSEEAKLRSINHLKEEVFPFLHRCKQLHEKEAQELKAVCEKFNGPQGLWKLIAEECDKKMANVAALGGAELVKQLDMHVEQVGPSGHTNFRYDHGGVIFYRKMDLEVGMKGKGSSDVKSPAINLVPFGAGEGMPYHHNMNPDDVLSLNPTLLELLQHLMETEIAGPFINFDHEKRAAGYYGRIRRPRCLSFIGQGLRQGPSISYGATAFFNDMLLVFTNAGKDTFGEGAEVLAADGLEKEMEKVLRAMGSVGAKLLAQYQAIKEQGPEGWSDPEIVFFEEPYNPHLSSYVGSIPDLNSVKAAAWDQLKRGQQRVQRLRARLASSPLDAEQGTHTAVVHGGTQANPKPAKRTHEESAEDEDDGSARGAKRQRSDHSARPGPSRPDTAPLKQAASKRPREPEDIDGNDSNDESHHSDAVPESRASKRQRLSKAVAPTSLPATSLPAASLPSSSLPATRSRASGPGSSAAPIRASSSKRARTPADADSDGDDQDDGDSHGPSGSKRRRLTKGTSSSGLPHVSPEAGPSTAGRATHEPADHVSEGSQAEASSAALPPAPQQPQQPARPPEPSSQALGCSTALVSLRHISKMGKSRPWLFGYDTPNGYGIYAFTKCPAEYCKCRFQIHPLKNNRAHDHITACGKAFQDEQDMVLQYASQVIKEPNRKSGLTIDWARRSNMILLPSNEKDNHPDNFPEPPADE